MLLFLSTGSILTQRIPAVGPRRVVNARAECFEDNNSNNIIANLFTVG